MSLNISLIKYYMWTIYVCLKPWNKVKMPNWAFSFKFITNHTFLPLNLWFFNHFHHQYLAIPPSSGWQEACVGNMIVSFFTHLVTLESPNHTEKLVMETWLSSVVVMRTWCRQSQYDPDPVHKTRTHSKLGTPHCRRLTDMQCYGSVGGQYFTFLCRPRFSKLLQQTTISHSVR
jgi:hypothetical protein